MGCWRARYHEVRTCLVGLCLAGLRLKHCWHLQHLSWYPIAAPLVRRVRAGALELVGVAQPCH